MKSEELSRAHSLNRAWNLLAQAGLGRAVTLEAVCCATLLLENLTVASQCRRGCCRGAALLAVRRQEWASQLQRIAQSHGGQCLAERYEDAKTYYRFRCARVVSGRQMAPVSSEARGALPARAKLGEWV